jgi:predicted outer membrane lipoprotein
MRRVGFSWVLGVALALALGEGTARAATLFDDQAGASRT